MDLKTGGFVVLSLLLVACAASPRFDTSDAELALTPQLAAARQALNVRVLWGGVIVAGENLADATRIEVLAYPLTSSQRPDPSKPPQGRFVIVQPGYLETEDYAATREVTVIGMANRHERGDIGDYSYVYPVVQPDDLYLWPRRGVAPQSGVRFGLGISISN